MTVTQQRLDALTAYALASTEEERIAAQNVLRGITTAPIADDSVIMPKLEVLAHEMLMEIGVPTHLGGYQMLVDAITTAAHNKRFTDDMCGCVYPYLAMLHNTIPSRAERSIRHCVEVCFSRGSYEKLDQYFGNTIDVNKGKATNGQFISTLGNALRIRFNKQ
jgi:hypothetical protein